MEYKVKVLNRKRAGNQFTCRIQIMNDWHNIYTKKRNDPVIHVKDETGLDAEYFQAKHASSYEEFEKVCLEHAQEYLDELLTVK